MPFSALALIVVAVVGTRVLHVGYSLPLQRAYAVADLSAVYPVVRGTRPLLASLGAVVLLGEPFTMLGPAALCWS